MPIQYNQSCYKYNNLDYTKPLIHIKIKTEAPQIECIIITAVDEVSTAVQAMQFGAYDYLVKPLQTEKLLIVIKNALEKYELRNNLNLLEKSPTFSTLQ